MRSSRKKHIKPHENASDTKVRAKYGLCAGIVGIICNALLFALKLAVGFISASITVIADAVNNLSDAGSSTVTLIGFKLSATPPDKDHPFGHARYEYITELIVAMIILFIGTVLLKSSIEKCIVPVQVNVSVFTYSVLAVSIAVKVFLTAVYLRFSKAIDSGALKAAAADSRNDVITTVAVLISSIVTDVANVNIDGYMGIAVSLFIIISSVIMIKKSMSPIIGEKPDKAIVDRVAEKILSYDGVIGMHDLVVHSYGADYCFAVAHVEVPADVDIVKSHEIIDAIEHDVWNEMHINLNIHMDPVDTHDEKLAELKKLAVETLELLDRDITLHDFRLNVCENVINVFFDAVIPYGSEFTEEDLIQTLKKAFEDGLTEYCFFVNIDRKMC